MKANSSHAIISGNVGGFLPGEKVISIKKEKVNEHVSSGSPEVTVPGGRRGSRE